MNKKASHKVYQLQRSEQFDNEFFLDLMQDYGGRENISAARRALCKQAAWRKLLLENAMVFIAENGLFVPDRRTRKNPKVHPLVTLASSIMNALRQDLIALGLDRKTVEKKVPTLDEYFEMKDGHEDKQDHN